MDSESQQLESLRKNIRILGMTLDNLAKVLAFSGGVTITQFHIIYAVKELKACSMVQLVKELSLEKSKVSRTVDQLVKLGLANREMNPENRRSSIISLTKKGETTVNNINKNHNVLFGNILSQLLKNKKKAFLSDFDLFVKILKHELSSS